MSKRALLVLSTLAVLTLAAIRPANADPPSFGRIVYGMTAGFVVLPQDAWQASDSTYGGGQVTYTKAGFPTGFVAYQGDAFGTQTYATAAAANSIAGVDGNTDQGGSGIDTSGTTGGAFSGGPTPNTFIFAAKLGFRASFGPWTDTYVYHATTPATTPTLTSADLLFSENDEAGTVASKTVANPFGFAAVSASDNPYVPTLVPAYKWYSQDSLNAAADTDVAKHIKAYSADILGTKFYFFGFEDKTRKQGGDYDYNDMVFQATFTAVPEPMFFQLGALLAIGGVCLWRMRRSNKTALQAAQT